MTLWINNILLINNGEKKMKLELILKIKSALIEVLNLSQETEVLGTTKLKDNLGLDSMSSLTFLVTLEENIEGFKVDPDTLQMTDLETVDTIANYVCRELKPASYAHSASVNHDEEFLQAAYA
jgi:acyl carrier protein